MLGASIARTTHRHRPVRVVEGSVSDPATGLAAALVVIECANCPAVLDPNMLAWEDPGRDHDELAVLDPDLHPWGLAAAGAGIRRAS